MDVVPVGDEHGLGWRVGVLEREATLLPNLPYGVVELDDLDMVRVLL